MTLEEKLKEAVECINKIPHSWGSIEVVELGFQIKLWEDVKMASRIVSWEEMSSAVTNSMLLHIDWMRNDLKRAAA